MKNILTLTLAAVLLLQTLGLAAFVAPLPCAEGCPDDGPDGRCSPACDDVCCTAHRTCAQAQYMVGSPAASLVAPSIDAHVAPADAAPTDIFHVPKPSLA